MPSQAKPQTTNLYEMDYLGRPTPCTMWRVENHHEVIEKEPDGNLLVLTSSWKGHIEDKIQEIDRQTGEVVNELIMEDIFGGKYEDRVDWTHLKARVLSAGDRYHCDQSAKSGICSQIELDDKGNPVDTLRSEILGRHRI